MLKPVNTATTSATFEDQDDAVVAAATTTAVAVAKPQAPSAAAQFSSATDVISSLKNAMPVTFDMLIPLIATNGNVCKRSDKKPVGDQVIFELMSWQDSYVVSPNDDRGPKDCVRYSDDGIVCSDGTLVADHLAYLRSLGFAKASCKQRAVVVGSIISCSRTKELDDELVQFDLSPQSRAAFLNYALGCVNKLRLGKLTSEQVTKIRATAEVVSMGGNPFTKLLFSAAV
jgi:hypothetical protein